jgi:SAM-dependent methyltransferase
MSKLDRSKWDQRYSEDSYRKNNPVTLVQDWLPEIPVGKALDVACGAGRNTIYLAQAGYRVDAIDISPAGLKKARQSATEKGLTVNWIEHDLDRPFDFGTDYDLILVMWYVNLGLVKRLCNCLLPGGFLLCEEHLVTDEEVRYYYTKNRSKPEKTTVNAWPAHAWSRETVCPEKGNVPYFPKG